MSRRRNLRYLAVVLSVFLVVAACGSGDDDETTTGSGKNSSGDAAADDGDVSYEPGIDDETITLGSSYPLSGPLTAWGSIGKGAQAYFDYVNEELGGVEMADGKRRKIEMVMYDDAFTPSRTAENVRKLVQVDDVFALFNLVGTAPISGAWEYIKGGDVPLMFYLSGASAFRDDFEAGVGHAVGWVPTYVTEAAIAAQWLAENQPGAKVAVLAQNDDFGADFVEGLESEADDAGIEVVAVERYNVDDPSVDTQITTLANSGADVFYAAASIKAATQAISKIAELGWEPQLVLNSTASGVGSVLIPAGVENSIGAVAGAYVKDPTDPRWDDDEGMELFRQIIADYGDGLEPTDEFAVNGMAYAEAFVKALERAPSATRAGLVEGALSLDNDSSFLVPGIRLETSADDPVPVEALELRQFNGDSWDPLGDPITATSR